MGSFQWNNIWKGLIGGLSGIPFIGSQAADAVRAWNTSDANKLASMVNETYGITKAELARLGSQLDISDAELTKILDSKITSLGNISGTVNQYAPGSLGSSAVRKFTAKLKADMADARDKQKENISQREKLAEAERNLEQKMTDLNTARDQASNNTSIVQDMGNYEDKVNDFKNLNVNDLVSGGLKQI